MGRIAANETLKGFNCTLHFAKTIFSPNQNHLSVLSVVVAFALEARKANQQWFSNAKHWRALSDQPAGDYFIRFDKKMKRKFRNIKAKKDNQQWTCNVTLGQIFDRYLILLSFCAATPFLLIESSSTPWSSTETPLWASYRQGRKEKGAAVDSKIEKKPKGRDTSRDGEDCVKGGAVKKMRHCTAPSLLLPPSIFKRELEAKNLINSFAAEAGKSSGTKARTHKKIFIC